MYSLLEYRDNYFKTSGSLQIYYRDEVNDDANENGINYRINKKKTKINKSFEYKIKILGSTPVNTNRLVAEVAVPLKYLSNFWRSFDLLLVTFGYMFKILLNF